MDEPPDTSAACPVGRLPPVYGESPEVIILGSFPSRQSLLKNEYYGNPRNHFWQIIEALFSLDRHLPYRVRTSLLIGSPDRTLGCYLHLLPRRECRCPDPEPCVQ